MVTTAFVVVFALVTFFAFLLTTIEPGALHDLGGSTFLPPSMLALATGVVLMFTFLPKLRCTRGWVTFFSLPWRGSGVRLLA